MDSDVTIALIGSATTILGPVITTLLMKKRIKESDLQDLSESLQEGLSGVWKGRAHQAIGPGGLPFDSEVTITLKVDGKLVTGIGDYAYRLADSSGFVRFSFSGGFRHERFLKLEYKNLDAAALQFGTVVLKISGEGQRLTGQYVGFGSIQETIVNGSLELEKQH